MTNRSKKISNVKHAELDAAAEAQDKAQALRRYREIVFRHAREKKGGFVANSNFEHAEIIAQALLLNANRSVEILSNHLDSNVFDSDALCEITQSFLGQDRSNISIIIEDPSAVGDSKFLDVIATEWSRLSETGDGERVRVFIEPENYKETYPFNLMVVDQASFRFEGDRDDPKAVAQFGVGREILSGDEKSDEFIAGRLSEVFKTICRHSKKIESVDEFRGIFQ